MLKNKTNQNKKVLNTDQQTGRGQFCSISKY